MEGTLLARKTKKNIGYHWGILQADGTVTHWPDPNSEIKTESLEQFARGMAVCTVPCRELIGAESIFTPKEIAERARSLNGLFFTFNFLSSNCESFVTWCVSDEWVTQQGFRGEILCHLILQFCGLGKNHHEWGIWNLLLRHLYGTNFRTKEQAWKHVAPSNCKIHCT